MSETAEAEAPAAAPPTAPSAAPKQSSTTAAPKSKAAPFTAVSVPLRSIVSNIGQSRGMGVLSTLKSLGYGIFNKVSEEHADKEPIWEMLTGDDTDLRSVAVGLIDENEPSIVKLATGLETNGQLQPIGVNELKNKPGKYNVIFGMRRCLATAYLNAKNPKNKPREMEAKLFLAANEVEMRFLSREENGNRDQESPIDRAMTYKWLVTPTDKNGGGMKPEDVWEREDISKVTFYQYVGLLDPLIEDKRLAIHAGEMSVDRATDLRKKRKENAGADDKGKGRLIGGQGNRFPALKRLKEYYDGALPENMSDELKALYKDDTVRKFLALNLGFKLTPFKEKPVEVKAEPKGKKKEYKITREGANAVLLACGHTDCETWSEADVIVKLENAPGLGEEGATLNNEWAQKWFDMLLKQYAAGYSIKLEKVKKPKAKA